jgi:hypothetical protein
MKNVVNIEHLQVEHLKVAEKLQIYATYRIVDIYITCSSADSLASDRISIAYISKL